MQPTAMLTFANEAHRDAWAVIMAGGDGTRLQKLTSKIAGDSRPKQFCRIFGNTGTNSPPKLRPIVSNGSSVAKFREFANE